MRGKDVSACLGYIAGDDNINRIYTLKSDACENFLMQYYVGGFMDQPTFYRAVDTKDQKIDIPKIIDSLDYDYWR